METQKMTKENSHLYIAIDTNIVIALASLYMYKTHPNINEVFEDAILKKRFKEFKYLFEAIKQDRIRVIVTSTTYHESMNFNHKKLYANWVDDDKKTVNYVLKFWSEYCYAPNTPDNENKIKKINKLARDYRNRNAIPQKEDNDSLIMAEAAVEGVNLLTFNGKDFVFESKDKSVDVRRKRILKIHGEKGIFKRNPATNMVFYPKPVLVDEFVTSKKINFAKTQRKLDDKYYK